MIRTVLLTNLNDKWFTKYITIMQKLKQKSEDNLRKSEMVCRNACTKIKRFTYPYQAVAYQVALRRPCRLQLQHHRS
jgi:hypothetical protein